MSQRHARNEQDASSPIPSPYCKIHIDEFVSTSYLISDIYVRLPNGKMIQVAKEGEEMPIERLRTYKDRKVEFIYVTERDYQQYADFNMRLVHAAKKAKNLSEEKRLRLFRQTAEIILGLNFLKEVDSDRIEAAHLMVEDSMRMISANETLFDLFLQMESESNRLYAHSVAVAVCASLIGRAHGWTSSGPALKVSMCGLLHDIGLKEIDPAIIHTPRARLTLDQIRELDSHPRRGRDILALVPDLPEGVAQASHQHHETVCGSGFPEGIRGEKFIPLARLVQVADHFCELVAPLVDGAPKMSPQDALRTLASHYTAEIDPVFFKRLCEIMHYKYKL